MGKWANDDLGWDRTGELMGMFGWVAGWIGGWVVNGLVVGGKVGWWDGWWVGGERVLGWVGWLVVG